MSSSWVSSPPCNLTAKPLLTCRGGEKDQGAAEGRLTVPEITSDEVEQSFRRPRACAIRHISSFSNFSDRFLNKVSNLQSSRSR
jgi:hypothetical protein